MIQVCTSSGVASKGLKPLCLAFIFFLSLALEVGVGMNAANLVASLNVLRVAGETE